MERTEERGRLVRVANTKSSCSVKGCFLRKISSPNNRRGCHKQHVLAILHLSIFPLHHHLNLHHHLSPLPPLTISIRGISSSNDVLPSTATPTRLQSQLQASFQCQSSQSSSRGKATRSRRIWPNGMIPL